MAENGETYSIQKIFDCPDDILNQQSIFFVTKRGERFSALVLKNQYRLHGDTVLQDYVEDLPLLNLLSAIHAAPNHLLLNGLPHGRPLKPFHIVFPVMQITTGKTFEEYAIRQWWMHKPGVDIDNNPLTEDNLIPNHALRQLIWLNLQRSLHFILTNPAVRQLATDYRDCLTDQIWHLQDKTGKLLLIRDAVNQALLKHPEWRDKSISELHGVFDLYESKRLNHDEATNKILPFTAGAMLLLLCLGIYNFDRLPTPIVYLYAFPPVICGLMVIIALLSASYIHNLLEMRISKTQGKIRTLQHALSLGDLSSLRERDLAILKMANDLLVELDQRICNTEATTKQLSNSNRVASSIIPLSLFRKKQVPSQTLENRHVMERSWNRQLK